MVINKNAVVAIAAMLSAGALFSNVGQARPPQVFTEMQDFQSRQAGDLAFCSQWTAQRCCGSG